MTIIPYITELNCCRTQSNMGDGDYMAAFHQLIMPVAYEVSIITLL